MIRAVNLYFDPQAENYITSIWQRLESLGIGRCMSCEDGRPHITLAIYTNLDLEMAKQRIDDIASSFRPFQLKLLQIGIFPQHKGTIFLTPNLADNLFQIHRSFHELFQDCADYCWDYYKPQNWYPHCTLSMETPQAQIPRVLEEILKSFHPFELTIESIGIAQLQPIEYLYEVPLKKDKSSNNANS